MLADVQLMKTNLRFISPLLLVIAASSIPLLGCRRIASDAVDRATEFAFAQGNDGKMDVRVGHLTDDFPPSVPIDPRADLVASARIETDAGEKGWMAGFQTDESPEQVLAFYQSRLHRMGGDAGPELSDLAAQLTAQGLPSESNGLQLSTTGADQKEVMTPFDFGSQGMLFLRTYHRDGAKLKPEEKMTLFTIVVVNTGRPKT